MRTLLPRGQSEADDLAGRRDKEEACGGPAGGQTKHYGSVEVVQREDRGRRGVEGLELRRGVGLMDAMLIVDKQEVLPVDPDRVDAHVLDDEIDCRVDVRFTDESGV